MIYAGCDLGIVAAKAVILQDGRLLAAEVLPYKSHPRAAAVEVMEKAVIGAGLSAGKVVPGADEVVHHIMCLHRAVRELNPRVRTVVDVGGHTLTAFNIHDSGGLGASAITDMCAAGTGRFIESMARVLEMSVDDFCGAASQSANPARITSQCVVLAESDVISHINDGAEPHDIIAGIAASVAHKIAGVVRRVDVNEEVALVGGVARNAAVVRDLERDLGLGFAELDGVAPQLVGAFGAAMLARARIEDNAG